MNLLRSLKQNKTMEIDSEMFKYGVKKDYTVGKTNLLISSMH